MKARFTRKEFLGTTARSAVAVSVGAFGGSLLAAASEQGRQVPITVKQALQVLPWPWPYVKLDPEDIRKRAHRDYYAGGCCYGAFNAIVSALAEKVGEPFTLVPTQMMYYGEGGGAGWGTLCGALNGCGAAIALVLTRESASAVVSELFGWYTRTKLPTDTSNDYAVKHVFLVNRYDQPLVQTASTTPLCHGSVSKWCTESKFKATSNERKERCARLTGDTAARAVELLNQVADARFTGTFKPAPANADCMSCHDQTYGHVIPSMKMECAQCHNKTWDHLW
jgi:hypothetical protein